MPLCSMNEVEAYSRRAARGAGMAWGLADEAGRAARWLTERGAPGAALLAALLKQNDGCDYASVAPVTGDARWYAPGGSLCPVCTGAALSDRAARLAIDAPLQLAHTTLPLLLAPFLAQAAAVTGGGFVMRWPGATVRLGPAALQPETGDESALETLQTDGVRIERCGSVAASAGTPCGAVPVDETVWACLTALAHRTYVPASAASRVRGAGAGTSDND